MKVDRGWKEIHGEASGVGDMPVVREGVGKGVTGDAPPKPA